MAQSESHAPLYEIADFFQVRMPLFPIDAYHALIQGESSLLQTDPLVQRAIAVGSLSLFDELQRTNLAQRDMERRAHKFLRYQIRMATRPTPYGLFAGVALGRWGTHTDLSLQSVATQLQVRPDMEWLLAIIWELESLPTVRHYLNYSANTAMLCRNGRIYVLNPIASKEGEDLTKVPSIRVTRPVSLALELTRQPISYADLHRALVQQIEGATEEQVSALLDELWRYGMLLTDLRPAMTGSENPARTFYERIKSIPPLVSIAERLHGLLTLIQRWERMPHAGAATFYRDLATQMHAFRREIGTWARAQQELPGDTLPNSQDTTQSVLQVDVSHELAGRSISRLVADEATRLGNMLMRISPPSNEIFSSEFKQKFIERYGTEREVPLLEVLSRHFGLGEPFSTGERHFAAWRVKRDAVLLELAAKALQQGSSTIELDEDVVARLENPPKPLEALAPSFDLNLFIVSSSVEAVERGDFQLVIGPNFGASQAGRNMGRFADLIGEEMRTPLHRLLRREQQSDPEAIWAEMVYIPYRARSANVALRPPQRHYEITFGAYPGVAPEHVIPLDQLTLQLRNDRFTLHWAKHAREVRVTVGHMLNALGAPNLVRFLELLPFDGAISAQPFSWGAAEAFPYLPRIQFGKSIVSLARWKWTTTTRKNELPCTSLSVFQQAIGTWRERWRVPRFIYLTVGDNRLLLDLDLGDHREILRQELVNLSDEQSMLLEEALPGPDDAWVPGPGGTYMLELNVPFLRRTSHPFPPKLVHPPAWNVSPAVASERRQAAPSSDWLFMKLYVSPDLQDDLLLGPIQALMQDAMHERYIDDWFFIRYADPEPHLRLRFHGEPDQLIKHLLPFVCEWGAWLMHDGPCVRFTFDVYDREIERYGGLEAMAACERLFGIDSRLALDLLLAKQRHPLDPLVLGAISVDAVVSALIEPPAGRLAYYRRRATNRRTIGQLYRQHGRDIYTALFEPSAWLATLPEGAQLLERLSRARDSTCAVESRLARIEAEGRLLTSREVLVGSLVHMHCNRFLGLDRQAEEQIVGLLLRAYESWEARRSSSSRENVSE